MTKQNRSWDEYLNPEETFLTSNPYLFLLFFALGFVFLEWLYFLVPDAFLQSVIFHFGIVQPCADLLSLWSPHETIGVIQDRLVSPNVDLSIVRGCDGSGVIFLLTSAILAFPTGWRGKILGMIGAIILVYVLNQVRLIGLYFIAAYYQEDFLLVHTYILPMLFILIGVMFFAIWSTRVPFAHSGSKTG